MDCSGVTTGAFDGAQADVLVSDDGRRHFTYVLTMSGYHPKENGNPAPTPIGETLENPREEAVSEALC